jgi:hypothetical protein
MVPAASLEPPGMRDLLKQLSPESARRRNGTRAGRYLEPEIAAALKYSETTGLLLGYPENPENCRLTRGYGGIRTLERFLCATV